MQVINGTFESAYAGEDKFLYEFTHNRRQKMQMSTGNVVSCVSAYRCFSEIIGRLDPLEGVSEALEGVCEASDVASAVIEKVESFSHESRRESKSCRVDDALMSQAVCASDSFYFLGCLAASHQDTQLSFLPRPSCLRARCHFFVLRHINSFDDPFSPAYNQLTHRLTPDEHGVAPFTTHPHHPASMAPPTSDPVPIKVTDVNANTVSISRSPVQQFAQLSMSSPQQTTLHERFRKDSLGGPAGSTGIRHTRMLRPVDKDEIKLLLLENISMDAVAAFKQQGFQVDHFTKAWTEDELVEKIGNYHAIGIRSKTKITKRVIKAASKVCTASRHLETKLTTTVSSLSSDASASARTKSTSTQPPTLGSPSSTLHSQTHAQSLSLSCPSLSPFRVNSLTVHAK